MIRLEISTSEVQLRLFGFLGKVRGKVQGQPGTRQAGEKEKENKLMDTVKEGMKKVSVTEEDAGKRVSCRQIICCGDL